MHALASAVGYFIMEAICRHSFVEAWNYMTQKPMVFAYNTAFIFTSSLIVYLFHRRVFWRVLVTLFWLILAIINGVLLLNRVTPFTGPDLHLITDALKVANKYLPAAGVVAVCILFGILVILLLILFIKGPKYQNKIKYRYNIPLILLAAALFAGTCTGATGRTSGRNTLIYQRRQRSPSGTFQCRHRSGGGGSSAPAPYRAQWQCVHQPVRSL